MLDQVKFLHRATLLEACHREHAVPHPELQQGGPIPRRDYETPENCDLPVYMRHSRDGKECKDRHLQDEYLRYQPCIVSSALHWKGR